MSIRFLRKCLEDIENGLKETMPDDELAERHIHKARHNLRAASKLIADSDRFLIDNGVDPDSLMDMKTLPPAIDEDTELLFYDWAIISSYYAIYHTILALLISIGYSSKNHACAIAALEHFFQRKKQRLRDREILVIKHLKAVGRDMIEEAWTMKDRRERTAYGIALSTEKYNANQSLRDARRFLGVAINILEEIRKTPARKRIRRKG